MVEDQDTKTDVSPEARRRMRAERVRNRASSQKSKESASSSHDKESSGSKALVKDFHQKMPKRDDTGDLSPNENSNVVPSLTPEYDFRLPHINQGGRNWTRITFVLFVIIPTIVAAAYYYLLASDQYISEFRFAITQATPNGTGASSTTAGMGALLGGMGLPSGDSNQNYIVADYLISGQAVKDLETHLDLNSMYSNKNIDFLSRLKPGSSQDKLADYWKTMITTNYDPISGLAIVQLRAFSAADVFAIANSLVHQSESLVNNIANRSKRDSVKFAEAEVGRAETQLKDVRARLDDFRKQYGVIDPSTSLVSSNVQVAASLRSSAAQMETEMNSLLMRNVSRTAPTVVGLQYHLDATKKQLSMVENEVSRDKAKSSALASVVARFEKLQLELQYGQSLVFSTRQALDQARANAAAQSLYMTPYVQPALPDASSYPVRPTAISIVALVLFSFWLVLTLITRSIMGH